ncbi:MAG TPA: hypothetical protein VHZ51_03185 [Ktedonobacteraceae bacterium]|jgi:hypothetical protein|nr:hypothetical protein [Ktedonobacteraceae bacterium]
MQGQPQQDNDPISRLTAARLNALKATGYHKAIDPRQAGTGAFEKLASGQQRVIPQRPPNMPHVDAPPPTPRIAKPRAEVVDKQALRRRLLILSVVVVICAIIGTIGGWSIFNTSVNANMTAGARSTTTDFLNALKTQNYDQAYKDLGPAITLPMPSSTFKQAAQSDDHCFGTVQSYQRINGNTASQSANSQSLTYQVTRSKSKSFQITFTLQTDPDSSNWKITNYGNNLGPSDPACS